MYYGADKECGVHVFDDNANVVSAGEIVEFKINGKINKVKTNNKGYASFSLNNLKAGKYTIEFSYKGFRTSSKITVKPTLITKNKKFKKAKTIKYTAKLLNKNGKVLKGKKITFKVKGKTYKAKTNKKGIATIKIKNLKVGKYKVVSKYGKQKSTSKITIKK
jgi:5-hydroxyisourate hydrolase-like protein (transthyretin family)